MHGLIRAASGTTPTPKVESHVYTSCHSPQAKIAEIIARFKLPKQPMALAARAPFVRPHGIDDDGEETAKRPKLGGIDEFVR